MRQKTVFFIYEFQLENLFQTAIPFSYTKQNLSPSSFMKYILGLSFSSSLNWKFRIYIYSITNLALPKLGILCRLQQFFFPFTDANYIILYVSALAFLVSSVHHVSGGGLRSFSLEFSFSSYRFPSSVPYLLYVAALLHLLSFFFHAILFLHACPSSSATVKSTFYLYLFYPDSSCKS